MIVQKNVSALLKRIPSVPIVLIVLLGAILRFANINWDSSLAFHPDERNIAWAVTRIHFFDQMNPKFFAYGGLPIYLYRALGELVAILTHDSRWYTDWGAIALVGRTVSATISTLSIFLLYLVGKRYFSYGVGLLASLLSAFSPWAIREAHFATTETVLVGLLLIILITMHDFAYRFSWQRLITAGILLGLAAGTKVTSLLFAVIPLTAIWLHALDKSVLKHHFVKRVLFPIGATVALLVSSVAIFLLTSPYTILDFPHFVESMRYETGVTLGRFTVPYTLQFLRTIPYLYQLETMLWQAGLTEIVGIAGLICLFYISFVRMVRGGALFRATSWPWRKNAHGGRYGPDFDGARTTAQTHGPFLFLIFPLSYLTWFGSWFAKFSRYNVPFLPFVTIAAAWLMIAPLKFFKKSSRPYIIWIFVDWLICLLTIAWGLANWSIYLRPQTRITASKWIYANIPGKTTLYTEHWNDGLPVGLPGLSSPGYNRELLNVYDEPDNETKLAYYLEKLPKGDYIILSTPRIWRTMPTLTRRYPITSRLYQKLFSGGLGYSEVARFSSYPNLFGITIPDEGAEETIQVFDHPTVVIFKNTKRLAAQQLQKVLQ